MDLLGALLLVSGVAECSQIGAVAHYVRGWDVTEHDRSLLQMTGCELLFNGVLALVEPIHGLVDRVLVHVLQCELPSQAAGLVFRPKRAGGGILAAGVKDATDKEGQHDGTHPRGARADELIAFQLAQGPQRSGHRSVWRALRAQVHFPEIPQHVAHNNATHPCTALGFAF